MPLSRSEVSACLVSRDPIHPRIMESLRGFGEIIVGDGRHGCCARWEAVDAAKFPVVYTQDDDCIVDIEALLKLWDGHFITNMPRERQEVCFNNSTLVGWGSLIKKELVRPALDRYIRKYGRDDLYRLTSDRIVAWPNKHPIVCVGLEHLPFWNAADRMWQQPHHWDDREAIRQRIETL
jgi:hypothetical protein